MDASDVTLESLFEGAVDFGEQAKLEGQMLAPAGTYRTVPALSRTAKVDERTKRPTVRFFGMAEGYQNGTGRVSPREGEGTTLVKTSVGFTMSPVAVYKDDGKPDLATRLFTQAVRAFQTAYATRPETVGAVMDYIRDYPVHVRVIQVGVPTPQNPEPDGEPGVIVVSVSAVRD